MGSKSAPKPELFFSAKRVLRYLLPLIFLGIAVHLILPQLTSLENSYLVIKTMTFWGITLASLAQAASYLGSGYLLTALAHLSNRSLSVLNGTFITIAGASFGMVAGGMVGSSAATYRWMQKKNLPSETATLSGIIPSLFNDIILIFVSLVGLVHLLIGHQLTRLQGMSFVIISVVLLGLMGFSAWGLRKRELLLEFANRASRWWAIFLRQEFQPQKIEDWLTRLFNAIDMLGSGGWRGPILGAVLNVAFDMSTLYFLFIAANHRISLGLLLTGYGLPLILGKMAFFIPGGVGIIESTMTALYASLGISNAVTVVVVLVYRILSFWLPLIIGFPMILVLEHKVSRISTPTLKR